MWPFTIFHNLPSWQGSACGHSVLRIGEPKHCTQEILGPGACHCAGGGHGREGREAPQALWYHVPRGLCYVSNHGQLGVLISTSFA